MGLFSKTKKQSSRRLEMILDHDGKDWIVTGHTLSLRASTLNELDKKVEQALEKELSDQKSLEIFMCCNNEVIPMWMRPYMNHYFNRVLELPLRYRA